MCLRDSLNVLTFTGNMCMRMITLLVKKVRNRRLVKSNLPRLFNGLTEAWAMTGHETVHTTVKLRKLKSIFAKESDDFTFLPICATAWPFDEDRRTAMDSRYSNLLKDQPKHAKLFPMPEDFFDGFRSASHVIVLPRATARARAREPQTMGRTP